MDRDAHRRFLEYRELFPYFNSPKKAQLEREEWIALDAELLALESNVGTDLTREDRARIVTLRRILLRD